MHTEVSTEPKKEQIRRMFDKIAPNYDRLNHILSFGIDRRWRAAVVKMVRRDAPSQIVDLASGTGDMAISMANKIEGAKIVAVDLSEQMLELARQKFEKRGLSERIDITLAEAEDLPFEDAVFDAVTVAFGIRNFHDIPKSLDEMARILRVGGKIYILEFSTPRNRVFGALYRLYFHKVLPVVGRMISRDRSAYRYLPDSVDEFPSVSRFMEMITEHGFKSCTTRSFMSGVAQVYVAEKR